MTVAGSKFHCVTGSTTLRLKFSSNGHFIETSHRRTQLCRMRHLVEFFPLVLDAKINHGVDAILDTVCVMCLSRDCGNCQR